MEAVLSVIVRCSEQYENTTKTEEDSNVLREISTAVASYESLGAATALQLLNDTLVLPQHSFGFMTIL